MVIKNIKLKLIFKSNNKHLIFVSLLIGIIIVGTFLTESYLSYKSEIRRAETQADNLAHVLEVNSANSFKKIDLVLQDLQATFHQNKMVFSPSKKYNDLLVKYKSRLPEVLGIKIVDENGQYIADDLGVISTKNIRDREYFQEMKSSATDQLIISKPVLSKTNNVWAVVLSRPILSKTGKFKGIILATISIEHFVNVFSSVDTGKHGSILLVGLDSYFYARKPMLNNIPGKKLQLADNTTQFLNSSSSSKILINNSSIDGVERVFSARKMKDYSFALIVGLSTKEFLTAWTTRTIINTLVIMVVLVVAGVILINFLNSLEELEEQRKQAIQSAKLSSLGEMASGIAHEINNPLTIISSSARSLKRKNMQNGNDPKINEASDKIIFTVERIAKIIRGLRTFGRDSFNDPIEPTSIKKILELTRDLCIEQLKDHSIELIVNDFEDFEIECREIQINQVLINLLSNARDALEGSENKWIKIEIKDTGNHARIIFSNSGKKISAEIAEKIMHPFFTTKEIGKGVGLGLSISKGIIEGHGGKFYLDLNAHHTTFVLVLVKSSLKKTILKAAV